MSQLAANARSPSKIIIDIAQGPAGMASAQGSPIAPAHRDAASASPTHKGHRAAATSHGTLAPPPFEIEESDKAALLGSASSGTSAGVAAVTSGSWAQRRVIAPFQRRVVQPAMAILKSGATAEGIALSLAFGLTGGMFPVPATTTLICVAFVFIFKLNLAAGRDTMPRGQAACRGLACASIGCEATLRHWPTHFINLSGRLPLRLFCASLCCSQFNSSTCS